MRTHTADNHGGQNSPSPSSSNRRSSAVLLRADTFPRCGTPPSSAAPLSSSQAMDPEQGRRFSSPKGSSPKGRLPSCSEDFCSSFEPAPGFSRLPSNSENSASSFESTSPRSSPPSLATLRLGMRAKKVENIVHARAAMKKRVADYRTLCETTGSA
ncbi:hypothetical protein T484DRAFT_1746961 [Baffinella frigidus]|nr:hypothetical protein T484DRAFT_1746961 [Cryptophyta sp. CCMP2293]